MEYPQITQITRISVWDSGRAKRTAKAVALSQEKSCLPRAVRKPALHGSDQIAVRLNDVSISQAAMSL
jgi:hypothetical protein